MELLLAPAPAAQYTAWDYVGSALLFTAAACFYLCYRLGFKIEAECRIIPKNGYKPCTTAARVVLGCDEHRWAKPVAWIRHMGAASRLDPFLYRLHITPPRFEPLVIPPAPPGPSVKSADGVAPTKPLKAPLEVRVAIWSLVFAIVQAACGVVALIIASG